MDKILEILLNTAIFFVCYFGMLMITFTAQKWARWKGKKLYIIMSASTVGLCLICGIVSTYTDISNQVIKGFLASALYFISLYVFKLPFFKSLYVCMSAVAYLSVGNITGIMLQARIWPYADYSWGLIFSYFICISATVVSWFLRKRIEWLLENAEITWMWRVAWVIPTLATVINAITHPVDYRNVSVGRIFQVFLAYELTFVIFLVLWQFMIFVYTRSVWNAYMAKSESQLYQSEVAYFKTQQEHMMEVKRLRHDLRHINAVSTQLLKEEKYDELATYLKQYGNENSLYESDVIYSKNLVVNAILTFYAIKAKGEGIKLDWSTVLDEHMNISDVDLSVVLGNLIENAINGCKKLDERDRYIKLHMDMQGHSELYITIVNSFDGVMPKKRDVEGLGRKSVDIIAHKYDGKFRYGAAGNQYQSNVMMRVKKGMRKENENENFA